MSVFTPGKAIRGGVPIIFPWFGARAGGKPGPAHGFARTMEWTVESTKLRASGDVEITLALAPSQITRTFFESVFHLRFRVVVGAELEMELETRNGGTEPFTFEEALHSYLAVADIRQTSVFGLEDTEYIDKTDGFKRKTQGSEPLRIAQETDQVHLNTHLACVVHDPVWNRRLVIEKTGSASTVVWNPWIEKTAGMSDMDAESWQRMICVETANASDNAIELQPGAVHKLSARVRLEDGSSPVKLPDP